MARSHVESIEVNHLLIVNTEDCSVVREHQEVILAWDCYPKNAMIVDTKKVGARRYARYSGGIQEDLIRYIKGRSIDRADRIEFAKIRQAKGRMRQFEHVAAK